VASSQSPRPVGFIEHAWGVLASTRTTAVIILAITSLALVAGVVPQGQAAVDLARTSPGQLTTLVAWGLSDVFQSHWIRALGALAVGNLLAVGLGAVTRGSGQAIEVAAPKTTLDRALDARFPEMAVETVRGLLSARVGPPVRERADGSRAQMVFDARSLLSPMLVPIGVLLLLVAAGINASERDGRETIAAAVFEITDSRTQTKGTFDMVANETFTFFQWPSEYAIQTFTQDRNGLGPAVMLQRRAKGQQRGESFWVYQRAPADFDTRHRGGEVSIRAISMGRNPVPGSGLADSPESALLLLGVASLMMGMLGAFASRGRIWVEADGRQVRIVAVPQRDGDLDFAQRYDRLVLEAEEALRST
jgi:hypothetical protein